MDKELLQTLTDNCYSDICIRNGEVCGILRFVFTYGVCVGLDMIGYRCRFCFDTEQNAKLFLSEWDGSYLPVVGEDGCTAIK